jgi:hypothetical protein
VRLTRAELLVRGALGACAAGGVVAAGGFVSAALAQSSAGDVDVLEVALVLERLEAELYERGLREVDLTGDARGLVREFGRHERAHEAALVELIGKLGGQAARASRIRVERSLGSEERFLRDLQLLEDTGVAAYNGAGPRVRNPDVLSIAGSIVQVEARHAAAVRLLRGEDPAPSAFDRPLAPNAVSRRIAPFL